MLSAENRLRSSAEFAQTIRRGVRTSRPTLTVHVHGLVAPTPEPAKAGLVVSKAVGGSVVRHRVARRLRHLLRERIASLPEGTRLVIRATPAAATATSATLAADLDAALPAALGRLARR